MEDCASRRLQEDSYKDFSPSYGGWRRMGGPGMSLVLPVCLLLCRLHGSFFRVLCLVIFAGLQYNFSLIFALAN